MNSCCAAGGEFEQTKCGHKNTPEKWKVDEVIFYDIRIPPKTFEFYWHLPICVDLLDFGIVILTIYRVYRLAVLTNLIEWIGKNLVHKEFSVLVIRMNVHWTLTCQGLTGMIGSSVHLLFFFFGLSAAASSTSSSLTADADDAAGEGGKLLVVDEVSN